jgi:MYXO-CTERM domain-containing protein
MCVQPLHPRLDGNKPSNSSDLPIRVAGDLDRRRGARWIAAAGLLLLVGVVAACSGKGDDTDSSASAVTSGRWALPTDVLAVGAKVRLTYDEAPEWTTAKACGGKLRPGGHVLGEYLMDHFAIISSVGGYSCRRNTADRSRMSVHGTGRALDVFIPMVKGAANNAQGDKVANWLVKNAQSVGVQLIIWDRSMWRANGTNDVPYGGPVPHIDHIHVELTNEAAAQKTTWFEDNGDGGDGSVDSGDPDATDVDSGTDDDDDAGTGTTPRPDAAAPPPKDAGTKDSAPTTPPPADEPDAAEPTTPEQPPATDPSSDPSTSGTLGDEPGETNSLPDRPESRKTPSAADDAPADSGGCSAAPGSRPTNTLLGGLGLMLGLGAWLRRRKRA